MIDMVGFGVSGVGGGGAAFPQAANLQGSWNLFGGNVNQTDNSGNSNDLSPNGSPGQAPGGGPDGVNCADLESSSGQRYGIAHASQVGLSPGAGHFAGCIFYNPESLAGNQRIVSKYENSGNGEWQVFYDFGDDRFEFVVRGSSGAAKQVNVGSAPAVGVFHFLEFYIDATAQEIGLALNNGAFSTNTFTEAVIASTAPFTIGERAFTGNDFADGKVAICHIWNVVPSAADRTTLYNGGNGLRYSP